MNEYEEYIATKSLREITEILSSVDTEKHQDRYVIAKQRYELLRKQRGKPRNDYLIFKKGISSLVVTYQDLDDLCEIKISPLVLSIFPLKIRIQFNNNEYTFSKNFPFFGLTICRENSNIVSKTIKSGNEPRNIEFKLNNEIYKFQDNSKLANKLIGISKASKIIGSLNNEDEIHNEYKIKLEPGISDFEFIVILGYLMYSLYYEIKNNQTQ
jgi:hypothetical protein